MIDWINTSQKRSLIKADVNIVWTCKRTRLMVRVSSGAMATKFKHAERLLVGADQKLKRVYLKASEEGYKVHVNKSGMASFLLQVSAVESIIGNERPSELVGDYALSYDRENDAYFFDIGALSR